MTLSAQADIINCLTSWQRGVRMRACGVGPRGEAEVSKTRSHLITYVAN